MVVIRPSVVKIKGGWFCSGSVGRFLFANGSTASEAYDNYLAKVAEFDELRKKAS